MTDFFGFEVQLDLLVDELVGVFSYVFAPVVSSFPHRPHTLVSCWEGFSRIAGKFLRSRPSLPSL
uniref:Uncharacterized protein n=1 Tax=Lepeophtheirus salmonis TaxID=72036 RepID=A0A0K2US03_LEPSM